VAAPLTEEDATHALKQAVPDLDRYLDDHSIEIASAHDLYSLLLFTHCSATAAL
jgi:hypothetical protein